ncbi:MAG: hypothetical protein U5R48_10245 [Gammaproteobacteria bacterium]|nr:hypothetical protein [Gammaproteobacteria bacterium]
MRILEGEPETVRARARELAPEGPECPWIGGGGKPEPAARLLGRDLQGAVIDTFDGIDANRFGAVAGALRGRCHALVADAERAAAGPQSLRPAL